MNSKVKDISIKNHTYYFFLILAIQKFLIQVTSYKNFFIYYIGYVTIKDSKYVKINIVNPLYLIFSKMNGYSEEINKNKFSSYQ